MIDINTQTARDTLRLASIAFNELQTTPFENGSDLWMLRWITVITLLRAALHVQGKENSRLKSDQLHSVWSKLKQHPLFKDFIEKERNNILKEFKFASMRIDSANIVTEDNQPMLTEDEQIIRTEDSVYIDGDSQPLYSRIIQSINLVKGYLDSIDEVVLSKTII